MHGTRDGGLSWEKLPDGPLSLSTYGNTSGPWLGSWDLASLGGERLLQVGTSGQPILSEDGGFSWTLPAMSPSAKGRPGSIATASWQFDAQREIVQLVSASTGNVFGFSTIAETSDGGRSWSYRDEPGEGGVADFFGRGARIQFVSPQLGWRQKDSGTLQRTADGGASWATVMLPDIGLSSALFLGPGDFQFVDAQTGWFVGLKGGQAPYASTILRTTDGGLTWTQSTAQGWARGVRFRDRLHGVVVGCTADIAITSDGGASWTTRPSPAPGCLNRVAWLDDRTVVAVGRGGALLRSDDAGSTWNMVATGTTANLVDLSMADALNGWVVGTGGTVLATSDGGKSWSLQALGSSEDLIEVRALGAGNARILGTMGGRYVTETAGR